MGTHLVSLDDVHQAAAVIRDVVVETPVIDCPWATLEDGDSALPSALLLKAENRQATGSFKLRGAYHALTRLTDDERSRGVVTHSSGNHGGALSYAARSLGVQATVVMPENSVAVKVATVRGLGAEVVLVPPAERATTAERLAAERGLVVIPPYDHHDVIAGQGTVGLEILRQVPDVEVVLVPVGGGGLLSGVATAVKGLSPATRVIGVEPEFAADARDSFRAGARVPWSVERRIRTVADGLRAELSDLTLAHVLERVDDVVTVSDEHIRSTIATLARQADVTAEPSGAVAAAAYLHRRHELPPGRTVAVVSGGNVDPDLLRTLLAEDPPAVTPRH